MLERTGLASPGAWADPRPSGRHARRSLRELAGRLRLPACDGRNELVFGTGSSFHTIDFTLSGLSISEYPIADLVPGGGRVEEIFVAEPDEVRDALRRLGLANHDGVVDEQGRLYFSSAGPFALEAPPSGFVMTADSRGRVSRLCGPLRYPNGITLNRRAGSLLAGNPIAAGRSAIHR